MNFIDFLKSNSVEVGEFINQYLSEYSAEAEKLSPKLVPLLNEFQKACEGGKRVRAGLIRLGYKLGGGGEEFEGDVLRIAAGYEIFQTAILSHDDIIDKDEMRRGNPSLYMRIGGGHYGVSQAIILSDIGFFLCVRCINQTTFNEVVKNRAIETFTQIFLNTGLGEMLDVEVSFKKQADLKDIETINLLKTADYSVVGPLKLGLVLSGNTALMPKIESFGRFLGMAFQLQDDLLGVFGSEEETGKSASSDIQEGKITLLYLTALERSDEGQKETLMNHYGKENLSLEQIEKVRSVFLESGAKLYCEAESLRLINLAKKEIEKIGLSDDNCRTLLQMADFLIERTK